ncbi:MAG: hypothetical protein HZA07_02865 [Nitrospirae bacterium]|nr:hypothetical protein [Nitrospirota bacterium]
MFSETAIKDGMEDWRIVSEISKNMGIAMNYSSAQDIMTEISKVSPLYRDLTYEEIESGDAIWPYKGEPLRGGLEEIVVSARVSRPTPRALYIALERPLFHSGTLSRKAHALNRIYPEAVVRVNLDTAKKSGLKDGAMAKISSGLGVLELPVVIDAAVDEPIVMLSNNFEGKGAFSILGYSLDPITKTAGIEGVEVTIQKVEHK